MIFAQYWPPENAFTLTNEAEDGNATLTTNNVNYVISIPENFPLNQSLVNLNYNDSIGKIYSVRNFSNTYLNFCAQNVGIGTQLIDCDNCKFTTEYNGTKLLTYIFATDYETVRIK